MATKILPNKWTTVLALIGLLLAGTLLTVLLTKRKVIAEHFSTSSALVDYSGSDASNSLSKEHELVSRESMKNAETTYFVMFYAPWCGYCKKAKPDVEALAKSSELPSGTKVLLVNADRKDNKNVALVEQMKREYNLEIPGFPTFYRFKGNGEKVEIVQYEGKRTVADMLQFLQ